MSTWKGIFFKRDEAESIPRISALWELSQMLASSPQAEEHVYFIRSSATSLVKTWLTFRDHTNQGQILLFFM